MYIHRIININIRLHLSIRPSVHNGGSRKRFDLKPSHGMSLATTMDIHFVLLRCLLLSALALALIVQLSRIMYIDVLYNGKRLGEKAFASFVVWGLSVFSAKIDGHTHS